VLDLSNFFLRVDLRHQRRRWGGGAPSAGNFLVFDLKMVNVVYSGAID